MRDADVTEVDVEGATPDAEPVDIEDGQLTGQRQHQRLGVVAPQRLRFAVFISHFGALQSVLGRIGTGSHPEEGIFIHNKEKGRKKMNPSNEASISINFVDIYELMAAIMKGIWNEFEWIQVDSRASVRIVRFLRVLFWICLLKYLVRFDSYGCLRFGGGKRSLNHNWALMKFDDLISVRWLPGAAPS